MAAFTIASTSSQVMSPCTTVIRPLAQVRSMPCFVATLLPGAEVSLELDRPAACAPHGERPEHKDGSYSKNVLCERLVGAERTLGRCRGPDPDPAIPARKNTQKPGTQLAMRPASFMLRDRILVVDANPIEGASLRAALFERGFDAVEASSADGRSRSSRRSAQAQSSPTRACRGATVSRWSPGSAPPDRTRPSSSRRRSIGSTRPSLRCGPAPTATSSARSTPRRRSSWSRRRSSGSASGSTGPRFASGSARGRPSSAPRPVTTASSRCSAAWRRRRRPCSCRARSAPGRRR